MPDLIIGTSVGVVLILLVVVVVFIGVAFVVYKNKSKPAGTTTSGKILVSVLHMDDYNHGNCFDRSNINDNEASEGGVIIVIQYYIIVRAASA